LPDPSVLPAEAMWRRPAGAAPGPLLAVVALDGEGAPVTRVRMGETATVRIYFRTAPGQAGHLNFVMKNRYDQIVSSRGSLRLAAQPLSSGDAPFAIYELEVDMMLEAGLYSLQVAFSQPRGINRGDVVDDTGWFGPFLVDWDYERDPAPFLGMLGLPVRGRLVGAQAAGGADD